MSPRLRGAALALANRLNARAWTIYRGDTVVITRGKDRGETGVVSEVRSGCVWGGDTLRAYARCAGVADGRTAMATRPCTRALR